MYRINMRRKKKNKAFYREPIQHLSSVYLRICSSFRTRKLENEKIPLLLFVLYNKTKYNFYDFIFLSGRGHFYNWSDIPADRLAC